MASRTYMTSALALACILFVIAEARPTVFGKGSLSIQIFGTSTLIIGKTSCPAPADKFITAQAAALLIGKASIKDPQGKLKSWDAAAASDACKWEGVSCEDGLVTQLDLEGFGLQGGMPTAWTAITTLQELDVSANEFTGPIPSCYGNLAELEELEVNENKLSGALPKELGKLKKLEELEMQDNNFSGTIPAEWGNMKSLKQLSLHNNPSLSGCIPVTLKSQGIEIEFASKAEEEEFTKDASAAFVRANTGINGFC